VLRKAYLDPGRSDEASHSRGMSKTDVWKQEAGTPVVDRGLHNVGQARKIIAANFVSNKALLPCACSVVMQKQSHWRVGGFAGRADNNFV
jgi:hypothetical protein